MYWDDNRNTPEYAEYATMHIAVCEEITATGMVSAESLEEERIAFADAQNAAQK